MCKHVRLDEKGRECFYHPVKGEWLPGHKEKKAFVWDFHPKKKFYDDKRTYDMPDGTKKRVRLTRYTYEFFHKYDDAPKGRNGQYYKLALNTCKRNVYYDGERFWQACDVPMPDGTWFNHTIKPLSGVITDCYKEQSESQGIPIVTISLSEGIPYQVEMDGFEFPVAKSEWKTMFAEVLHLREV